MEGEGDESDSQINRKKAHLQCAGAARIFCGNGAGC
jgi:hypothetical protein